MKAKWSDMTPEAKKKYHRDWYAKNGRKKSAKKPAAAVAAAPTGGGQVQPVKLEIKRLADGVDPGEAFFYIADSLQVMNGHLKRICDACEKAGGL
jgi:hypothetical protein